MANTFKFGNGQWATQEGLALAYNDENDNYKPLPFDFTRASSATRVNKQGLIETVAPGFPRIDYLNNTKGALLLEPSRTNSITYSEDFSQSAWSKTNTSITSNSTISPDGNSNADSIVGNGASGLHYILNSVTVSSGQNYTFSIFAKVGTNNFFQLNMGGSPFGSTNYCNFNLLNGTIGSFGNTTSNRFIEKLGNGWYRIGFTATSFTSGSANFFPMLITSATSSFLETNTLDTSVKIYGAQLEVGSYATSYIPTSGSAVTRAVEASYQVLPYNIPKPSTMYVEMQIFGSVSDSSSTATRYSLNESGTASNWVFLGIEGGDNLRVYVRKNSSNTVDSTINNVFSTEGVYKIAMRIAQNDVKVFVNGVQKFESTLADFSNDLNNLNLSGGGRDTAVVNNAIKNIDFRLYNTALTDSELIALTS